MNNGGETTAVMRLECWACFPGCLDGERSLTEGARSRVCGGMIRSGEGTPTDKVTGEETVGVVGEETVGVEVEEIVEVEVEVFLQPI